MMRGLFLSVLEISVSVSLIIFVLLALSPYLNKRYAAKWNYFMWIAAALRLAIPFSLSLPERALVISVPEQIIAPAAANTENAIPIILNTGANLAEVSVLDIAAHLWGAGAILFLSVHLLCCWHYKHKLIKNALPIEEDSILRQIDRLSGELHIKPAICAVRDSNAGSPMMIGFLKPVLVLPDGKCSEEELFFILKHELIHYKHRDIYFKLLFVIANAIHWFNPLVYIMREEAAVDMELYCDESVIGQAGIAERKAYTEALLSAMGRQYKRGTALTTRFYGGKKIMKKRFKNVLLRTGKKNGWLICVCAVCLTLMSGAMIGCTAAKNLPSDTQAQTDLTDMPPSGDGDIQTVLPIDNADGQTLSAGEPDTERNSEEDLSTDAQEIQKVIEKFASAYFDGNTDAVQKLLPETYGWDVDVYEGTGTVSDITLKGLPETDGQPEGTVLAVSLEYRDSNFADTLQYLTVELIKQDGKWEIQFYGVEG